MPRTAVTRLLLTFLILSGTTGCMWQRAAAPPVYLTALPVAKAPQIELRREAASTISTVSHQLEPKVEFVDVRADEERFYYPGETDPHRWRDAMTILPMESFQSDLEVALREQVVNVVGEAHGFKSIEIRVSSFHVALDERDRGEEQLLYEFREWDDEREAEATRKEELRRRSDECEDSDDGLFDALFRALVVAPIQKDIVRRQKYERTKVAPQTIPEVLTQDKHSGWNCRLTADVLLLGTDDQSVWIPINVTSLEPKDDAVSVERQIERTVTAVVEKFGIRLNEAIEEQDADRPREHQGARNTSL